MEVFDLMIASSTCKAECERSAKAIQALLDAHKDTPPAEFPFSEMRLIRQSIIYTAECADKVIDWCMDRITAELTAKVGEAAKADDR